MKLRVFASGMAFFLCPGCKCAHRVTVASVQSTSPQGECRWAFNGDADKPTLWPSVLTWWNEAGGKGSEVTKRCHSFVAEGRIQFLSDSTHSLAGQVVDLPEWGSEGGKAEADFWERHSK